MSGVVVYSREERKLRKSLGLLIASVRLTILQVYGTRMEYINKSAVMFQTKSAKTERTSSRL